MTPWGAVEGLTVPLWFQRRCVCVRWQRALKQFAFKLKYLDCFSSAFAYLYPKTGCHFSAIRRIYPLAQPEMGALLVCGAVILLQASALLWGATCGWG
ncbi:hypothetical protein PsAD46_05244 [Pseudovibrio sp. Ad46]|nr:hypothetical protein PsAD46_05244 [Pseudovibrio sp. Ad46]KZK99512.1 hypothetical protein PsAD5_01344 [Pseudovibrio sp. Ad5]